MTMNWVRSVSVRIYRAQRVTFTSSNAASISSMTQKGVGCTFKMEKYKAMATKAFSPPERREMVFRVFPGGWALISMPQARISFSSSSSRWACPPPNNSTKVVWKLSFSSRNCSAKMRVISPVIPEMMPSRSFLACSTSSRWPVR